MSLNTRVTRNNRNWEAVMKYGADNEGTGCGMLTFVNSDIHGAIYFRQGVQTEDDYLPFEE